MEKIADTKMYPEDLNSPRREFPNEGLDIVVTLLVRPGIIFCVCFYCGSDPAVTFWQVDLIFSGSSQHIPDKIPCGLPGT